MNILLSPALAFLIYLLLVAILSGFGRLLAGPGQPSDQKSSPYASGEAAPPVRGVPGYGPFFVIALFFAILHLGALVLGLGGSSWIASLYLAGLAIALIALILE